MAKARNGSEIKVGHKYMFAETAGDVVRTVTEIIDDKVVRIDDHWGTTRWASNALFEIQDSRDMSDAYIANDRYVYKVVDKWPSGGYQVWNIGRHNFEYEGYIPLAQVDANYRINPATLKALYVGDEGLCLAVLREASLHNVDEAEFNEMKNL